jgi:hypothetical protein
MQLVRIPNACLICVSNKIQSIPVTQLRYRLCEVELALHGTSNGVLYAVPQEQQPAQLLAREHTPSLSVSELFPSIYNLKVKKVRES